MISILPLFPAMDLFKLTTLPPNSISNGRGSSEIKATPQEVIHNYTAGKTEVTYNKRINFKLTLLAEL